MASTMLGYIFGILGLAAIFIPLFPKIQSAIPYIGSLNKWIFIGAGIALVVLAVLMLRGSSGSQPKEIPIYEGKGSERKVVGIQRVNE